MLLSVKEFVLIVEYISQLVGYALGVANLYIYIVVGMPIYPIVAATVLYIVFQLHSESSVYFASDMLWAEHFE